MTTQQKPQQKEKGKRVEIPTSKLRRQHFESRLAAPDAYELLLEGNAYHKARLAEAKVRPEQRFEKILFGQAEYLAVACSDARHITLDSEFDGTDLVGMQIRAAGNVIPSHGASRTEFIVAGSKVRPDGLIIIQGHSHCGAVKEYVNWDKAGQGDTGSKPMNALLAEIAGRNTYENTTYQLGKASQIFEGDTALVAMVYDWDAGQMVHLGGSGSAMLRHLMANWQEFHDVANSDGNLAQRLANQTPHTITIGYHLLPFSVDTIFKTGPNEVFSTTGSEGGLDLIDEASFLYAVEHLHAKHVVYLAPGNVPELTRMYDKWEEDLRTMGEVAGKIDSGELTVRRLQYNLIDGAVQEAA